MAKSLLLSGLLGLAWVVAQMLVARLVRPVRIFNAMTLLFVPTVPALVLLYAATPPDLYLLPASLARTPPALGILNGLLVHLLLYCTWVEAFFYIDRPVTLRLLVEFVKAPGGYLTVPGMQRVYGLEQMIASRLESLRVNGYVDEREGRYVLTPKGRALAGAISLIRRALGTEYYLDALPASRGDAR